VIYLSKGKAGKFYKLTPKSYRYMWAVEAFYAKLKELKALPDDQILEMVELRKLQNG